MHGQPEVRGFVSTVSPLVFPDAGLMVACVGMIRLKMQRQECKSLCVMDVYGPNCFRLASTVCSLTICIIMLTSQLYTPRGKSLVTLGECNRITSLFVLGVICR